MKHALRAAAVTLVAWAATGSSAEATTIVFNDVSRFDFQSGRTAGNSPLADITVSSPTTIDEIGVYNDLSANGDLEFLIFNLDSHALLFESPSEAFVDDGLSFKLSNLFAPFTLLPGINYGIGAIADVAAGWGINNSSSGNPFTQGAITASDDRNGNVSNFTAPTLGVEGAAMIIVELGSDAAATPVPEPATLTLTALGLAGVVSRYRHRRASR